MGNGFQAIPTLYNGVQYRSRLEARWAAFFDLLGWPHQYEPFDLKGWIPDFLLKTAVPVLVEVKPVTEFPLDVANEIDRALGGDHEALIVGCSIDPYDNPEFARLGWLRQEWDWSPAVFSRWTGSESVAKNHGRTIGFCHIDQSFNDRVTGCYDGGCYGELWKGVDREVIGLWNKAGNIVQWNKPTGS